MKNEEARCRFAMVASSGRPTTNGASADRRRLHLVAAADREREAVTPVAVLGVSYRVVATMALDRAA
jgi:hypothetical protein